ncbi:MAG: flavin reductase family protein [Candidatus Gagatemarchaeaceae archaeon]
MKVDATLMHRLFYPQVPAIFCAQHGGRVSAMPVVSYAWVSGRPPLVAVGCNPASFTFKLAVKARAFSLCLVDRRYVEAVERLATESGKGAKDKIADASLGHRKAPTVDAPIINEAVATLECELDSKRKLGDHVLLIGLVKASYASENFSDFWDFERYRPILYTGWKKGLSTYPTH